LLLLLILLLLSAGDDYAQATAGAYGAGSIHSGYKRMADQIWDAVAVVLDAEIENGAGAITDVLIGGHSVGGGLGMLLSTRIQVGLGLRV
jgi:hypothetical protein